MSEISVILYCSSFSAVPGERKFIDKSHFGDTDFKAARHQIISVFCILFHPMPNVIIIMSAASVPRADWRSIAVSLVAFGLSLQHEITCLVPVLCILLLCSKYTKVPEGVLLSYNN